jgi:hypothetical protein
VELGKFELDGSHLGVGYDNAAGVLAGVKFTVHCQAVLVVVAEINSTMTL